MKTSKSAVFLFELMVIILVFTFAAAICTQIFVTSYKMSMDSREQSMSAICAQTAAEKLKVGETYEQTNYDKNWQPLSDEDPEEARYTVAVENDLTEGSIRSADVVVYKGDDDIYTLPVKVFVN